MFSLKERIHYMSTEGKKERQNDLSFVVLSSYTHSKHYIQEIEKDKTKLVREKEMFDKICATQQRT